MAKRVFFSFHYQDVIDFRANVVRNHWLTKSNREAAGFYDASIWESAKKTGDTAVKRLINNGVNGTSFYEPTNRFRHIPQTVGALRINEKLQEREHDLRSPH